MPRYELQLGKGATAAKLGLNLGYSPGGSNVVIKSIGCDSEAHKAGVAPNGVVERVGNTPECDVRVDTIDTLDAFLSKSNPSDQTYRSITLQTSETVHSGQFVKPLIIRPVVLISRYGKRDRLLVLYKDRVQIYSPDTLKVETTIELFAIKVVRQVSVANNPVMVLEMLDGSDDVMISQVVTHRRSTDPPGDISDVITAVEHLMDIDDRQLELLNRTQSDSDHTRTTSLSSASASASASSQGSNACSYQSPLGSVVDPDPYSSLSYSFVKGRGREAAHSQKTSTVNSEDGHSEPEVVGAETIDAEFKKIKPLLSRNGGAIVYFSSPCMKYGSGRRRLLMVGESAVYLWLPSGRVSRCFPVATILETLSNKTTCSLGFRLSAQHDLLVTMPSPRALVVLLKTLQQIGHRTSSPPPTRDVRMPDEQLAAKLFLTRPEGWHMTEAMVTPLTYRFHRSVALEESVSTELSHSERGVAMPEPRHVNGQGHRRQGSRALTCDVETEQLRVKMTELTVQVACVADELSRLKAERSDREREQLEAIERRLDDRVTQAEVSIERRLMALEHSVFPNTPQPLDTPTRPHYVNTAVPYRDLATNTAVPYRDLATHKLAAPKLVYSRIAPARRDCMRHW